MKFPSNPINSQIPTLNPMKSSPFFLHPFRSDYAWISLPNSSESASQRLETYTAPRRKTVDFTNHGDLMVFT